MTTANQMIEQHIREYQSRMQHIDELMERARTRVDEMPVDAASRQALETAIRDRDKLTTLYEELKLSSTANWRKEEILKGGPMGLWDVVAQQLERLVERLER
jgi:hypothetical protein